MPDTPLHFCASNRAAAIRTLRAFADGIEQKLIPAFGDIENEADAFAAAEHDRMLAGPAWEGGPDAGDIAERAMDRGLARYEDLAFVRGHLHALAVAGLYHLWERTLKDFLLRELNWFGGDARNRKKLQHADFETLVAILGSMGFHIESDPFYRGMNLARLVTNAIKHGEGPAFDELKAVAPHLVRGPMGLDFDFTVATPDDIWIDGPAFAELAIAFRQFWEALPEDLSAPPGWAAEPSRGS